MKKVKPPYLYITSRGEFTSLDGMQVIPTLSSIIYWFITYRRSLGLKKSLRIALALSFRSVFQRAQPPSTISR